MHSLLSAQTLEAHQLSEDPIAASLIGFVTSAAPSADMMRLAPPSPVTCTVVIAFRNTVKRLFVWIHLSQYSRSAEITILLLGEHYIQPDPLFEGVSVLDSSSDFDTTVKPSSRVMMPALDTGSPVLRYQCWLFPVV